MRTFIKAGLASAAIAASACLALPAAAADLGGGYGGSIKDTYAPAPVRSAGPCYVRLDSGYSWAQNPSATYVENDDPTIYNATLGNSGLIEGGVGCGMGSRGLRGEISVGYHGEKKFKGDYIWSNGEDPTMHTSIQSTTVMLNGYWDMGNFRGFVPYIGAGFGLAWNHMSDITFSNNPLACVAQDCRQWGEDKVNFAWAVMAGVGYHISDRAVLDIGYRYIDMGSARGSNGDNHLGWNPRLVVNDVAAHEVKVGLRYYLGASDCCATYAPMK